MKIIGILLLVVVLGGGVWYATKNKSALPQEATETETSSGTEDPKKEGMFSGTLSELTKRGGDHKCTFSHTTGVGTSSGTVYISGTDMRGDFVTNVVQPTKTTVESHMIKSGEWVYTWSPMMPMGFKSKATLENTGNDQSASQSFDYNQSLNYDCKLWVKDPALFIPPSNITFNTV